MLAWRLRKQIFHLPLALELNVKIITIFPNQKMNRLKKQQFHNTFLKK